MLLLRGDAENAAKSERIGLIFMSVLRRSSLRFRVIVATYPPSQSNKSARLFFSSELEMCVRTNTSRSCHHAVISISHHFSAVCMLATTMAPPVVERANDFDEEELVTAGKPSYSLVRLADDDSFMSDESTTPPKWQRILQRTILPDECFEIKGVRILDGQEAVRFLKFVVITFIGMVLVHWFVAFMVRLFFGGLCCLLLLPLSSAKHTLTHHLTSLLRTELGKRHKLYSCQHDVI